MLQYILYQLFFFDSDPTVKQYLLHLDETNALGQKFVIEDLDDQHIFVTAEIKDTLMKKIDAMMEQLSYSTSDKQDTK